MRFRERPTRSLMKTISYRVLIICSTFIITFFITGKLDLTIAITLVANLTNTVLYFFHERLWDAIHWGKIKA